MSYEVKTIRSFDRDTKRLTKKYPSLRGEIAALGRRLEADPHHGTPLGQGCYKGRLQIASKGGGKSGGARVITALRILRQNTVYLLAIYDKSSKSSISDATLASLLANLGD